jgi:rfaE bifunctional protein kinase chain/domain
MADKKDILSLFEAFHGLKAMIIGDVMIDAYYRGKVERISPEAPVPIVHVSTRDRRLGGAANVAINIKALGATPVLCSVIGEDSAASDFENLMLEEGLPIKGILKGNGRTTTVKTRIISGSQQLVRIDEEEIKPLSTQEMDTLLSTIAEILQNDGIDVVIFEDYDKGVISPSLIKAVVALAREIGIPTAVDPKKKNFLHYRGVNLFKPNFKELQEGLKKELPKSNITDLQKIAAGLPSALDADKLLLTLSEMGALLADRSGEQLHVPAHLRSIADVSGAGDTVIAVASLCMAAGADNKTILELSNLAGGLVCEHVGVVPINRQNLLEEALSLL